MNERKKLLFQALNHLDDCCERDYICGKCNNWLTCEATKVNDDEYICESCSLQQINNKPLDLYAKKFFQNLLHPCQYEQCDFIGKNDEILAHEKQCEHAPMDCHLCNKIEMNSNTFKDHCNILHKETTFDVDSPQLTLSSEQLKNNKFIVIYKHHLFLLYIKMTDDDTILVNVAKLFHNSKEDFSATFRISLECEDVKQKFSKDMILLSDINKDVNTVPMKVLNPRQIKIVFCKLKKVNELGECPICNYSIGLQLYQCSNGHNVCKDCGTKITQCAICRRSPLMLMNSNFLYPNILKRCAFSRAGCLFIGEQGDCMQHESKCLYHTITCPYCSNNISKNMLKSHFLNAHQGMLFENGSFANVININGTVIKTTLYTYFNNELFVLEYQDGFCVSMFYNPNTEEVQKYSFEIQILDNCPIGRIVYSLRSVCQANGRKVFVAYTDFVSWKDYMHIREMYFKCIITKRNIH